MKIAKRIDISYGPMLGEKPEISAILLVDIKKGTSGWLLQIEHDGEMAKVEASSATVMALMMAERKFKDRTTRFYEVDKK